MTHTESSEDGATSSSTEGGPSRASEFFAIALIMTSAIVAGLVLFAALASPA
jgi:hypothetical protein